MNIHMDIQIDILLDILLDMDIGYPCCPIRYPEGNPIGYLFESPDIQWDIRLDIQLDICLDI